MTASRVSSYEYARALARSDVNELRGALKGYFEWQEAHRRDPHETRRRDDLIVDPIIHDTSDPDRSLALVALAMAEYDDPIFLGLVAAGPLEDLLMRINRPSEDTLLRILEEARRTPRFRWMLSGIYRTSLISDHAAAIKRAVKGMSIEQSLPGRPLP